MFPLGKIGDFSDWNSDRTVEKFIFISRLDVDSSEFLPQKKQMIAEFLLEKKQNSPGWKISVKNLNTPDILNCVTNKTEPIIRKHTYIKNPHCGMHVQNCCLCATK